ncbi:hypothetical protein tinsulaeT_37150 [Thalassotalea insulae]|uniref:Type VI secretion system baseplate subunit TssK n=1 Tax=Thalassotalea insulae TaxID=2056778 RepID=A0ABQ6H017_9GAMM|nr:type VI secretion system baseplate subunit TssK [Thalassotalea insulae]GLX80375.1 hypothetical protein tinsulaeT_37150 [Thalassotalea insulae]
MSQNYLHQHGPLPLSVCWHEGMLLSPQHFQQDHIFWESQLQSFAQNAGPYRWGVISMKLDEGRLLEGEIYITELRAVMPDGLLIDYKEIDTTASGRPPLQLDISDSDELLQNNKVMVQLTVPIRLPGSASNKSDIQRFLVVDSDPVKDDNTGEGETDLQRLLPIMSLQAAKTINKQYVALPLFEVLFTDGPQYKISDYCPPMLSINADDFLKLGNRELIPDDDEKHQKDAEFNRIPLQRRLQRVALDIRKKAKQLAGFSEGGDEQFGLRVTEQHRLWIRAMVQHLAEFELVADNPVCSPWQTYQVLARLIGSMSDLDAGLIPPKLPRYRHEDCWNSLEFALRYVNNRLKDVNVRYTSLAMDEGRNGIFSIMFDKAWDEQDLLIELKPRPNQSVEDLEKWMADCRIASPKIHKELAMKRILGASTTPTESDDATGITSMAGHALFYIKFDAQFIKVGQPLTIVCTNGKLKHHQPKRIMVHLPHEPGLKREQE